MGKVAQGGWRCQRTDLKSAVGDQCANKGRRSANRGDFESFQTLPGVETRRLNVLDAAEVEAVCADVGSTFTKVAVVEPPAVTVNVDAPSNEYGTSTPWTS